MSEERFVYDGIEVRKTGRTASKPSIGGKRQTLVEIEPVYDYDGLWKKWVHENALFEIDPPKG